MKYTLLLLLLTLSAAAYCQNNKNKMQPILTCKLTSAELQKRKATIIAKLKTNILAKTELPNGYTYTFTGSDARIDELTEFIKTERQCCDFFDFTLKVAGKGTNAWLSITGPGTAKQFIHSELGL